MFEFLLQHYNYWMFIGLMMIGFYAMMAKKNLIKKIIGMNIFQSAIILFFISTSVKGGGVTVPILEYPHKGAKTVMIYRRYDTLEEDEISLRRRKKD